MNAHASNLDIEKFRKVHALMRGGATEGERKSARAAAARIAKKAGIALHDAVSMMDNPQPKPTNIFEEIFNTPEMRARRAERGRKDAIKREMVLREYGSVEAVFEPTPWEVALRAAVAPFSVLNPYSCEITGADRLFTQYLDGEMAGDLMQGTERAKAVIATAVPMPTSIAEAMAEIKAWNKLRWDRNLFFDMYAYGHSEEAEVTVRVRLVERFIEVVPVRNWQDMEDRFAWKKYEWESQWIDPTERDDPVMNRIEDDFRILRELYECAPGHSDPGAQSGHRTTAQKRDEVLSMLDTNPELSSREIARRVGVSPQTVATWRARRMTEAEGSVE